jgi:hypothetical protein
MGKKSRDNKSKNKPTKKYLRFRILSAISVIVIILVALSTLIAASYLNWDSPLLPRTAVRATDVAIASVSFLPKTPKQVLTKAIFETGRVKSGEHNFSLLVKQKISEEEERAVMFPKIKGPFKKSEDQVDIAGTAFLGFPNEDEDAKSEINFVEQDDYLYFQVKNVPPLQNINLSKLDSKWHKIDMTKVASDAKANIRSDEEIGETISEKMNLLFDTLASEGINQKISTLSEEEVSGQLSFHYKLNIEEALLEKIKNIFVSEGEFENLNNLSLDLWIDKSNFHFSKLEIKGELSNDPVAASSNLILQEQGLFFEFAYELRDAGEDVEIRAPEEAKEVSSLLSLYLLVQDDRSEKNPAGVLLGATSGLGEFGANFLTIERLLHVLYLTPQSF